MVGHSYTILCVKLFSVKCKIYKAVRNKIALDTLDITVLVRNGIRMEVYTGGIPRVVSPG